MSEYYSIARDSEQWAVGINSGEFLRHADLLAQAKAALGIHPSEAAWRLTRARQHIGLSTTSTPSLSDSPHPIIGTSP